MKVLLVDDHFVVREGLAALLRGLLPDVEVNEAGDGEEALQAVQREIPSLVIVDLGLPGISGLELTRRLRQRLPQLRVLFFSLHDELALVRQALDAGARGYVTKRAAPTVLLEAIRRVLAGQLYLEQPLATRLACQSWEEQGGAALRGLTRREFEIFRLLARGLALREVAEHLGVSAKTVSNHVSLLKQKLQVSTQAELVHRAIDSGVLRLACRCRSPRRLAAVSARGAVAAVRRFTASPRGNPCNPACCCPGSCRSAPCCRAGRHPPGWPRPA